MKTSIAVYNSHEDAIYALKELDDCNFPMNIVSIIGQAEITDDKIHLKSNNSLIAATPLITGSTIGTVLGLLVGVGTIAIPGLGVLFGAGAIIGAFGGFELGSIAGGLGSILLTLGLKDHDVIKYEQHIKDGKYLLYINGSELEIETAQHILNHEHAEINIH
jgi:uncharacterized membrane protein